MNRMIRSEKIKKEFGEKEEKTLVLNEVELEVSSGEFVVIMGQSGSGKSTLLYSISGMDSISSGRVLFEEKDLTTLSEKQKSGLRLEKMGFIFQHPCLLKDLTIEDNILLPAMRARKMKRKEMTDRAESLMKKMGIAQIAKRSTTEVSGGQLQRASICRALMNMPEVLYADEPTGALNRSTTKEIMDILNAIHKEGMTIVLVTHDAKVAARADRVIYLADGKIEAEYRMAGYQEADRENRESQMNEWLVERGF